MTTTAPSGRPFATNSARVQPEQPTHKKGQAKNKHLLQARCTGTPNTSGKVSREGSQLVPNGYVNSLRYN